jgi:hypothetical protein
MSLLKRLLSDSKVQEKYVKAGSIFGDAVSYLYMGECVGFENLLNIWDKWEQEYAKRGYKTLSIDKFIEHGGYGESIADVVGKKRGEEEPVHHAKIYRQEYLGKFKPVIDMKALIENGEQAGVYHLPSTEK